MPIVRLFAAARHAAGTGRDELPGDTVAAVLDAARARYGAAFGDVLGTCRIWVNGDAADLAQTVSGGDEVAVLPPVSGGSDGGLPGDIEAVRARRQELQELDDAISYVRRVAQARADLAAAERSRRGRGGSAAGSERAPSGDLAEDLRDVLAERLLGGPGRPPRPAEDFSDHPRAIALDQLCAEHGYGRLDELADDELAGLVDALQAFEHDASTERQAVHVELDRLTERLVEGYHDRYAADDDDRSDGDDRTDGVDGAAEAS